MAESTPDQTRGPLDGRRGYGETSPSTSARAIDCARHMYPHSAYTEGMRKMSPFRIQNGRLPCARKYGNATAIFETKPLYEKRLF